MLNEMLNALSAEKLDLRLAEEHRIRWREGNGPVDAENRNLQLVASLDLFGEHDAVRHIEALNRCGTRSADASRHLPIDPGLGVVVDGEGQHRHRPVRLELSNLCWNRQVRAKPRHEQMAAATAFEQSLRLDCRP